MRDLYLLLDLDSRCDDLDEIRQAIEVCADEQVAETANHVLLDPHRKERYDQLHQLLSTIGQLRADLRLPLTKEWEALENQDFDQENPRGVVDLQGDLDRTDFEDDFASPAAVLKPRPRRKSAGRKSTGLLSPSNLAVIILSTIGVCVLVIAIHSAVTMLGSEIPLPANGQVNRHVDRPTNSKLTIDNEGAGNVAIDFIMVENDRRILSVFIHEGMSTTFDAPSGKYELRYSVGKEEHWNGKKFEPQLRELAPTAGLELSPEREHKITIPKS